MQMYVLFTEKLAVACRETDPMKVSTKHVRSKQISYLEEDNSTTVQFHCYIYSDSTLIVLKKTWHTNDLEWWSIEKIF